MSAADVCIYELDQEYPFLNQIAEIRRRARGHIANGSAITHAATDREVVLRLLDESLASELVCVSRFRQRHSMVDASLAQAIREEYLKQSKEEQQHADRLAERIAQLGGAPSFDAHATLDHSESDHTLADLVEEDLIAERIAIENYREIIQYIGDKDATTRRLFESILAVEEEHAKELASMRQDLLRNARGASTANATPLSAGELQ
jgi:bacterioferritin